MYASVYVVVVYFFFDLFCHLAQYKIERYFETNERNTYELVAAKQFFSYHSERENFRVVRNIIIIFGLQELVQIKDFTKGWNHFL